MMYNKDELSEVVIKVENIIKPDMGIQNAERINQIVDNLTLFDDDLMSMVFDGNIPATELLLKAVLKKEDMSVISVVGQRELQNPVIGGRNICLDILAKDNAGIQYNVEVQQSSAGAAERRARFHSSMIDTRMLKERQKFTELLDSYVIFITKKDYFGYGLPIYTINRHCEETDKLFQDGSHIIYVNGSYKGNDEIGRLMHDFACKDSKDIYFPELAKSVRHFKEEGGRKIMCEAVEKYANQCANERAIQADIEAGIAYGVSKDKIIARVCDRYGLSLEEVEKLYAIYASATV